MVRMPISVSCPEVYSAIQKRSAVQFTLADVFDRCEWRRAETRSYFAAFDTLLTGTVTGLRY
jgi:hypothetical protein